MIDVADHVYLMRYERVLFGYPQPYPIPPMSQQIGPWWDFLWPYAHFNKRLCAANQRANEHLYKGRKSTFNMIRSELGYVLRLYRHLRYAAIPIHEDPYISSVEQLVSSGLPETKWSMTPKEVEMLAGILKIIHLRSLAKRQACCRAEFAFLTIWNRGIEWALPYRKWYVSALHGLPEMAEHFQQFPGIGGLQMFLGCVEPDEWPTSKWCTRGSGPDDRAPSDMISANEEFHEWIVDSKIRASLFYSIQQFIGVEEK